MNERAHALTRPWIREIALFAAALVVYQGSRALVVGTRRRRSRNAEGVIGLEKATGLFVETDIQGLVMGHQGLVSLLNQFYLSAHWIVTPLFFIWLYRRRHAGLSVGAKRVPCRQRDRPCRLHALPGRPAAARRGARGLCRHAATRSRASISTAGMLSGWFNPHAAVPSMHFGYAFLIGVVGVVLVRSPVARALLVAYPALVLVTIVGTANHYVLDAIAGGVVVGLGFAAVGAWALVRGRGAMEVADSSPCPWG